MADVVTSASEIVIESLIELENEEHMKRRKSPLSQ